MQRDLSLDLARGFTVLCIPAIHSVMVYAHPSVYTSLLGLPLWVIAEGPGAQLFMTLMGMGIAFKSPQPWTTIVRRSLLLLLAGYALNICKFVLPLTLGALPMAVQRELQLEAGWKGMLQALLIGDILHFAALAFFVVSVVRKLPDYWFWSTVLAGIAIMIAPFCWDKPHLSLLGGQPPQTFFPFFPWIVYPLLGITIGTCWQRDATVYASRCGWMGAVFITFGVLIATVFEEQSAAGFYRTLPGQTLWHIGVVLITLFIWKRMATNMRHNHFFTLLQFCSRHITTLYCVQWILICWLLPLIGYQTLGTTASFFICGYTTAITLCIGALVHHRKPLL
jgi:hypothetical protein